ncbi:hypothetical protein DFH05DRAFT_1542335 [Lentinula detonsa]|uniref:Uncharacterized protein n=1 Tax=Lentinula detonsa TaxID=2804962 RepID=A0A9W8TYA2_9AGAR|nr:hypothetical protein DFH05DRAFT_1542335 [Lentinula detonsa]KAJ3985129.1 hypothetical protein F5890DRAFT_1512291 [Lentinula detonsa]
MSKRILHRSPQTPIAQLGARLIRRILNPRQTVPATSSSLDNSDHPSSHPSQTVESASSQHLEISSTEETADHLGRPQSRSRFLHEIRNPSPNFQTAGPESPEDIQSGGAAPEADQPSSSSRNAPFIPASQPSSNSSENSSQAYLIHGRRPARTSPLPVEIGDVIPLVPPEHNNNPTHTEIPPPAIEEHRLPPAYHQHFMPLSHGVRTVITFNGVEYLVRILQFLDSSLEGASTEKIWCNSVRASQLTRGSLVVLFVGPRECLVEVIAILDGTASMLMKTEFHLSEFELDPNAPGYITWLPGMSMVMRICGMQYLVKQIRSLDGTLSQQGLDFSQAKIPVIDSRYCIGPRAHTHVILYVGTFAYLVWIQRELAPSPSSTSSEAVELDSGYGLRPSRDPSKQLCTCIGNKDGEFNIFSHGNTFLKLQRSYTYLHPPEKSIYRMQVTIERGHLVYLFHRLHESQYSDYHFRELFIGTCWSGTEMNFRPVHLTRTRIDSLSDSSSFTSFSEDPEPDGWFDVSNVRRGVFDMTFPSRGIIKLKLLSDPLEWPTLDRLASSQI